MGICSRVGYSKICALRSCITIITCTCIYEDLVSGYLNLTEPCLLKNLDFVFSSSLFQWCPIQFLKYICSTSIKIIFVSDPSGGTSLYSFDFLNIILGIWVPDGTTIFNYWSYIRVITFSFYAFRTR